MSWLGGLGRAASEGSATDSAAFRRWFGDSVVVNPDGSPKVVYHGTVREFDKFETDPRKAGKVYMLGSATIMGAYFSDSADVAGSYPFSWQADQFKSVMPVYLSIRNPIKFKNITKLQDDIDAKVGPNNAPWFSRFEHAKDKAYKYKKLLIAQGYDGITFREGPSWNPRKRDMQSNVYVAFYPTQIKSAVGNRGTFDPKSRSILKGWYR